MNMFSFLAADRAWRPVVAVALALLTAAVLATRVDRAYAEEGKKRDKPIGALTERTYKRLTVVHQLIGEKKYGEALALLQPLNEGAKPESYEKAVILQTYGFIYAAQSNYNEALRYLEQALKLDVLPDEATSRLVYNVAQLHIALNHYRQGLKLLLDWLKTTDKPTPDAHALAAIAYAELKEYRNAIPHVRKAVELSSNPQESWFQLWLSMHYELKEYPQAAEVLEQMVRRFPHREKYWKQLSSIYLEIKEDDKALATLELAYTQGYVKEEKEIMQLVNLYLFRKLPFEAAQVLEKALNDGTVAGTQKTWELLGNAWMDAQEINRAIPALEKAGAASKDGEIELRVAYLYIEKENWKKAADALLVAVRKGGLKNTGMAYVMLGMTAYESKQYDKAIGYFNQAREFDKTRQAATEWLNHVQSERAAVN